MLVAAGGAVLVLIVECGVHGDVGYLGDVSDVGGGDDLGDVSRL